MASSATSKKTGLMSPRVMKMLSLAVAFLLGAAVVYLIYQLTGGSRQSYTTHGGSPPVIEEENKPSTPDKRRLIKDMLLPRDVKPTSYNLKLKAYLPGYGATFPKDKELTFDATIVLHLTSDKEVNEIVLNSVDLEFKKEHCFVETSNGKDSISDVAVDEHLQRATFKLNRPAKGDFTLTIVYSGKIRPQLNGLYQTKYTNGQGVEKIAAVTQMEPQDARKMVPCFDEPEWKATWNVTILHPKGTNAISNGIERGEPHPVDDDFLETSFKPTPAMSSYLLAVLISDFTYAEGMTKNNVRFRIYSRPEAKETTQYALMAGIRCLEGLEDFYGIKFPLEKQDMVALNWGLITYRETALLYDQKNYNMENKRRVATVIAHELAHMWFGDLVTMRWWDDIWLNEGFASFVENIGVDIISDGKFDMENTFVAEQHGYSMSEDSSRSSHPIINNVEYNEEIDDLFDTISYKKGATFISMVNHLLGKNIFQQGIKAYFNRYKYQNTEHGQLFAEWDKVVPETMKGPDGKKLNVTEFALKWTTQMGYPYLTLTPHNATHDEVIQTRYLINPNATERAKFANPKYKYIWDVPVWYQVGASKDVQLAWLPYEGHLYLPKTSEAVVLNADSYAMARMNFDKAGWEKILEQLKKDHTVYSPRTRYRIVSDVFALAEIDKISYDTAFNFAQYFIKEENRLPWMALFNSLDTFHSYWGSTPDSKAIDNYKKKLLQPIYKKLDIKTLATTVNSEENHIRDGIKITQWLTYCGVNKAECKPMKEEFFEENFNKKCGEKDEASRCSEVPPAIRGNIYCSAVRDGDAERYDKVLNAYKKETLQLESRQLLRALTCTHDVVTLKWLLGEVLNRGKGIIRGQDVGSVFQYLSGNEVAAEFLLDFLIENWDQIHKLYSEEQSILNHIVEGSTANIRSKYQLEKLKSFVKEDKNAQKYFVFTKAEHKAAKKIDWLEKNGKKMVDLLHQKTGQL